MATKPATTFTFATGAVYTVGPFIGSATKVIPGDLVNGNVPSTGIVAEYQNYLEYWTGQWITNWVDLGSSAAGLDAHIVETDASGFANIARLTLGGTAAGGFALSATENSGATGTAISATNNSGGFAILASASTASPAVRAISSGAGEGLEALNVGGGGPGLTATGNGSGAGAVAAGGASGNGVTAESGTSAGHGVVGTARAFAGNGVRGLSRSAGDGPSGGSVGVLGTAQQNDTIGVAGFQGNAGSTIGTLHGGVYGFGLDANGVIAQSTNAYGLWAQSDTTSPARAALHLEPQDDDPATGAEGDKMYNSTTDEPREYVNSRWQTVWTTQDGFTRGLVGPSSAVNNNSAAYTTLSSCQLPAPYDPKHTGSIMIHAAAEFGANGGTVHTVVDVRLYDVTSAAVIWQRNIDMPAAVAGPIYDRPWSIVIPYGLPGTGPRTIELQFRRTGGAGTGIQATDGGVFALGVF